MSSPSHGSSSGEYHQQYKPTPPPSTNSPHHSPAQQTFQESVDIKPPTRYQSTPQPQDIQAKALPKIEDGERYQEQFQQNFQNLPPIQGLTHNRFNSTPRPGQRYPIMDQERYNTPLRHIVSGYQEGVDNHYQPSIHVKYERPEEGEKQSTNGNPADATYVTLETVSSINHQPHASYQQIQTYSEDSPPSYNQPASYMTYRAEGSPSAEMTYVSYAQQKDESPGGSPVVYMKSDPTLAPSTSSGGKAMGYPVLQGHYEQHGTSPGAQQVN